MNFRGLLDQLLGAGQSALTRTGVTTEDGGLTEFGKGAATGGALGLLLGSKTGRKLATYGGLAALGVMAWRAYTQDRPEQQPAPDVTPIAHTAGMDRLILRAMLAAARVDGIIDAQERTQIDREITRLGGDEALRLWVDAELQSPLDPQLIANDIGDNTLLASEAYLASALVIAEPGFLERSYLDRLADCLRLDPGLKQRLEQQAQTGDTR